MLIGRACLFIFFLLWGGFSYAQTNTNTLPPPSVGGGSNSSSVSSASTSQLTVNPNSQNNSFYDDPSTKRVEDVGYGYFFLKTLIILIVFAIIAYFVARFLKKKTGASRMLGGPIEVLYSFPMGVGRSVEVLKIVSEMILVSNTQEGIQFICKIEDKEAIDLFKLERDKQNAKANTLFGEVFSKYTKVGASSVAEMTKNLKERLEKMRK